MQEREQKQEAEIRFVLNSEHTSNMSYV